MVTRVLLVDDEKDQRDSVRAILSASGHHVMECADTESALALLTGQKFDLILIALAIPATNGNRILDYIKQNHIDSKVIVITGQMGLHESSDGVTVLARDYITKPYDPNYLLTTIRHVLSNSTHSNLKLEIIKAGDFLKSTPTGNLDMLASKKALAKIALMGKDLKDYTVLIDVREVKSLLTTIDLYELASELVHYGKTFQRKTAVLSRPRPEGAQAAFFVTAAQNQGLRVKGFTVFEQAILWLSTVTERQEILKSRTE